MLNLYFQMFSSELHELSQNTIEDIAYQDIFLKNKMITDKRDQDGDQETLSHISIPYIPRRVSGKVLVKFDQNIFVGKLKFCIPFSRYFLKHSKAMKQDCIPGQPLLLWLNLFQKIMKNSQTKRFQNLVQAAPSHRLSQLCLPKLPRQMRLRQMNKYLTEIIFSEGNFRHNKKITCPKQSVFEFSCSN